MNALLVLISLTMFLALISLSLRHQKKIRILKKSHPQSSSSQFSNDLAALNAGSIGLGERLLRIERNQKLLAQKLEQLELHSGNNASYSQAINLVKQGINKEDLMSTCELSETEAGLLMVMHKNRKQRKSQLRH